MAKPEESTQQADKFRDLARQLECDEDEARFENAVRKVAKAAKPPGEPNSPKARDK